MDVYLMDVNSYCKVDQNYIIGESTVLRFNIKDGIKDTYHEVINPGNLINLIFNIEIILYVEK